jgi:hypothetical protein
MMTEKEATYFLDSHRVEELCSNPPKGQLAVLYGVFVAPGTLLKLRRRRGVSCCDHSSDTTHR